MKNREYLLKIYVVTNKAISFLFNISRYSSGLKLIKLKKKRKLKHVAIIKTNLNINQNSNYSRITKTGKVKLQTDKKTNVLCFVVQLK